MHKGVIAVQAAHKLIDDEYLKIATGERDTYAGFVIPSSDGLMTAHVRATDPHNSAAELLQIVKDTNDQLKAEDKTKDKPMVLYFASTDVTHDDDLQPFVLLKDGKNQTLLAVFLEGEFEEEFEGLSDQSPQHHTPEFFATQSYLVGKVADIHRRTDNITKTVEELKQPSTYKEIVKSLRKDTTSRMVATFVASNGDIFSIKQNDKEKSFDWGHVSQAFGYEEKAGTTAPVVSSKSVFATPSPSASPPSPQSTPGSAPDNLPKGPDNPLPDVSTEDDPVVKYKDVLFIPGPNMEKKRNILKNFYKHWGGDQILGELDKIRDTNGSWVEGTARFKIREKMRKEIDKALADKRLTRWEARPIADVKPITQVASAAFSTTSDDAGTRQISMILRPEERDQLQVLLPRIIAFRDEKGQPILDPTKLGEYEKSVPTLGEQIGKPEAFIPLSPDQWDIAMSVGPAPAEIMAKRLYFQIQGMYFAEKVMREQRDEELNKLKKTRSAFAA